MHKIANIAELKNAIQDLESQRVNDWLSLKNNVVTISESLKPLNIVKNSVKEMLSSTGIKTDAVDATLGLTSGIIAKKLLFGNTHNPIKKLLGNIIEVIITGNVVKNSETIKKVISNSLAYFGKKK